MNKKLVFLSVLLSICFVHTGSDAVTCPNTTVQADCESVTGCVLSGLQGCKPCAAGQYYDNTTTPFSCPNCPATAPKSAAGSTNGTSDCKAATVSCNDATRKRICGGAVSGDATWKSDNSGAYDYSNCKCEQSGVTIDHGKKSQKCNFSSDGTSITTTCSDIIITSCDAGYYANNNTCETVGTGYYSVDDHLSRAKCPYASTTDNGGATNIDGCYFAQNQQICDKTGRCYEMPSKAKLSNTLKKAAQQNQ